MLHLMFESGIYFYFFPGHLILILLGLFIANNLKTAQARWIWLGVEVVTLVICEIVEVGSDFPGILSNYVFYILAFNLLLGHGITVLVRAFRLLVDWLNRENSQPKA